MLHKTHGIVLNYIKFKETSVIVKVFTEVFGVQSYIVNGIRSKNSKKSLALFQPLTILDLVVYSKKNENKQEGIKRLSEYKPLIAFKSIPFDIKKSSIAIFATELLAKSLKEEQVDENGVFKFLEKGIQYLDHAQEAYENFHVQLMIQLTDYIGFGISDQQDIRNLMSTRVEIEDFDTLSKKILLLRKNRFDEFVTLTNEQRKSILNLMIGYYSNHVEGFKEMKSKTVLNQVFG